MSTMSHSAHKYRLYPNSTQRQALAQQFGACRWLWNNTLDYIMMMQQMHDVRVSYGEMSYRLTHILKKDYPWICDVGAQALQQVLMDLDQAIRNHNRTPKNGHKWNYPRFKKYGSRQTARYPQRTSVNRDRSFISVTKIRNIKIKFHRDLPDNYTRITIVKESDGKYYAVFIVPYLTKRVEHDPTLRHIGLDVGITTLVAMSDGTKIDNPRHFVRAEVNLTRKNRALAKKKKGSRKFKQCRLKLARVHARVRRQRNDFLHKLSHSIVNDNNYQGIAMETLKISSMVQNHHLAKHIGDAGWHKLRSFTQYKARDIGKTVTPVHQWFASTRICNCCYHKGGKLDLKIREWQCTQCLTIHDRDVNAAKNLALFADRTYHQIAPYDFTCIAA